MLVTAAEKLPIGEVSTWQLRPPELALRDHHGACASAAVRMTSSSSGHAKCWPNWQVTKRELDKKEKCILIIPYISYISVSLSFCLALILHCGNWTRCEKFQLDSETMSLTATLAWTDWTLSFCDEIRTGWGATFLRPARGSPHQKGANKWRSAYTSFKSCGTSSFVKPLDQLG